jgi:Iron-containing redox enzyme
MPTTKSQTLQTRIALASALLSAATEAMIWRPDLPFLISTHLVLLHQITRASVPLMEAAHREANRMREDRVSHALIPYLERHIEEERNHDEWTLDDLASVGIGRAQTLATRPSASVAALVGAQYYWILHYHPVALLGYMAVLESNAPSDILIERLQAKSGLPDSAFRTHRIHAALDPEHQAALYGLVDRLPLDSAHESLIADSALHTAAKLADCLADTLAVSSVE